MATFQVAKCVQLRKFQGFLTILPPSGGGRDTPRRALTGSRING